MPHMIKLSIQEIVYDFEMLIRCHQRLRMVFDIERVTDEEIEGLYNVLEELISKYLPNYKENVLSQYFSEDMSTYEKALILYNPLYENFKRILYQWMENG